MRNWAISLILAGLAACSPSVDLSAIPEQVDAPDYYINGGEPRIRIVGSSTVAPFSTTVAEQFGAISGHPAPIVETTGTGGGFKAFCRSVGASEPSIINASRQIKPAEVELCQRGGISEPVEVKIGFDGIVFANAKTAPDLNLTKAQIYTALAARLPDGEGGWYKNPYKNWNEIDPALPDMRILVSGPPPTSGTRDAFAEIAMEGGAVSYPVLALLREQDLDTFRRRAHEIRNDGAWIDSGENDSSIINTLLRNEDAIGVLGYSFLEQNLDRIKGAQVDGVAPSFENIASRTYAVSRSLYFYVKRENIPLVPGLTDYVREFTREDAWGPDGYLVEKGLIPLFEEERRNVGRDALAALRAS